MVRHLVGAKPKRKPKPAIASAELAREKAALCVAAEYLSMVEQCNAQTHIRSEDDEGVSEPDTFYEAYPKFTSGDYL